MIKNGIATPSMTLAIIALSMSVAPFAPAQPFSAKQQFSADLVSTAVDGKSIGQIGKVYVANRDVRIETPNNPGGFFVVHGDLDAAYFVRPAQRIYMDSAQSSVLTQILVPVDPNDPCQQWQAMATIAGATDQGGQWRCQRIGEEHVDGRDAVKYRATSPRDQPSYGWIDRQLGFPIRFTAADGTTVDLQNIQQGPQSTQLFEIPSGYRKFDPQQLIDRIKQSDVWVAPPN
jgi:hypothetical protein